ncbi:hypothetical protein L9F63_023708, partial [Diploptera punctata]
SRFLKYKDLYLKYQSYGKEISGKWNSNMLADYCWTVSPNNRQCKEDIKEIRNSGQGAPQRVQSIKGAYDNVSEPPPPLFQHLMFKVEILCTQHIGQGGGEG